MDQILCAAGPLDAVTNQALAYRRLFARWGWSGQDYAPVTAAGLAPGTVAPLHQLTPGRAERVVVHYSGYAPGLEELIARCPGPLLISHNVTPPRYFWTHDPAEAVRCQLAVDQLTRLAAAAGGLAGGSHYNAAQLGELSGREARVIALHRRLRRPRSCSSAGWCPTSARTW